MNNKIITFSFDDGNQYDIRLVALFNKYHLKCTFNINTGLLIRSHTFDKGGFPIEVHRLLPHEMLEIYDGHEIACHALTHRDLSKLSKEHLHSEISQDIQNIKALFHLTNVPSMAYPYGIGSTLAEEVLKENGVKFARLVNSTYQFDIPKNLLAYSPSIYYRDPKLNEVVDQFLKLKTDQKQILCIWGHSYELEGYREWEYFEKICQKLAFHDDISYLTNGEAFLDDDSGVYKK